MTSKRDYFIQAMKAESFRRRAWVFSVFSMTKEDQEKDEIYPFKVRKMGDKYVYRDPSKGMNFTIIEDSDTTKPLLNHKDRITISKEEVLNVYSEPVETNFGNVFFNFVALIYPFGNKIPFLTGRISARQVENYVAERLASVPEDPNAVRDPNLIYVDEYLKFGQAVMYLTGFSQLWVPGGSPKTLTCHPDTAKVKAQLIEKYKDQLHDPAIIARIEAELIKFDKENWIKGDPDAEGFLIKKKSTDVVRKKMFLMYGAEAGFDEAVDVNSIFDSLQEGWDIKRFPEMLNVSRVGSFNRGAQTQLGGEAVKWLLRASSNMGITEDDCGTTIGIPFNVTDVNASLILQRYIVTEAGPTLLTDENIKNYINKTVTVRSPMFCKLDKTDYCAKCCGDKLATHKTGLSMAVSDYGSSFLEMFMSAMHAKALTTAKLNINNALF